VRFDGLAPSQESNHFRVIGTFTVSNGSARPTVMQPAKKFYPQESSPIAGVDYELGFREDLYLVLGDFTRDGTQATVKIQVNRLVSWIWIGGLILTLGTVLAILPERRKRRPPDTRVKRAWPWLIPLSAIPLLLLLAYGFRLNPRDIPSPLVGRPAAAFALTTFDGQPSAWKACAARSWC